MASALRSSGDFWAAPCWKIFCLSVAMVPIWARWIEAAKPAGLYRWSGDGSLGTRRFALVALAGLAVALAIPQVIRGSLISSEFPLEGIRHLKGILPEETRTRVKKTGWNAPAHVWFGQGSVAADVRDLIASRKFRERGIYNVKEVERLFEDHQKIIRERQIAENHMMFFWQLVNLELWFEGVVDQVAQKGAQSAYQARVSGV